MELLYLISSILYNSLLTFTLSLFLPFQYIHHSLLTKLKSSNPQQHNPELTFYQGTVWHDRLRPKRHSFRYEARYALIDLDRVPNSLHNHLSAHQARDITSTNGPVFLLTIPASVGYEQNPLSVYYCYDLEGSSKCLKKCIAEVTNTPWGERVTFVFDPHSDVVAKPLHVSPFMDMLGNWIMRADEPGDNLLVVISVQHPTLGDYFTATLKAKRVTSGSSFPIFFFWLMPQKVAFWIYWQAVKLWWKNVKFIQHPRYMFPNYREEALERNRILSCCKMNEENGSDSGHLKIDKSGLVGEEKIDRWCVWSNAKWPWN